MSSAAPALSVVVPIYNEGKLLEQNLRRIHAYLTSREIEHEILAVSNGSTDRTVAIGTRMAGEHDWLKFPALPERGGWVRPFDKDAAPPKGEIVVSVDLDLPSDMQFLEFAYTLRGSYDLLIGSKFMGFQQRRSPVRGVLPVPALLAYMAARVFLIWRYLALSKKCPMEKWSRTECHRASGSKG